MSVLAGVAVDAMAQSGTLPRTGSQNVPTQDLLMLNYAASGPGDLAVSGRLRGLRVGEKRYIPYADLAALPAVKLKLVGEYLPGEQEVSALFLTQVWNRLPREADADTLLAFCKDGYVSIYPRTFLSAYRPFLAMQINGRKPDQWPVPGAKSNPGPYAITVAESVAPAAMGMLDLGHKKPWGVTELMAVNQRELFRIFYEGPWVVLSPRAQQGREIWIHSCFSCHTGPEESLGGTKSGRPFEVIAAHAGYNKAYFKRYVRDPQAMLPGATMEKHAHYTDEQLEALIAFLIAEGGK